MPYNIMFEGTTMFNGDLSSWDVSEGRDFRRMFRSATAFDGDLSSWKTGEVTSMMEMFS